MGWLIKRLGNGLWGMLDIDNPDLPPEVTVTIASAIPDRPSEKPGRVHKEGVISAATTDQTVYTVTEGKTLYVTSIDLSVFNTSTVSAGRLDLKDGTTIKQTFSMSAAGVGAVAASVPANVNSMIFLEPKQFTTDFNMDVVTGTLTYSVCFTGYEE